jgi:hypothetical protein
MRDFHTTPTSSDIRITSGRVLFAFTASDFTNHGFKSFWLGASTRCATWSCGHGTAAGQLILVAMSHAGLGVSSLSAPSLSRTVDGSHFNSCPNQPRMSGAKSLVVIWKVGNN